MRGRHSPIPALEKLATLDRSEDRRAAWRQALAALGEPGRVNSPPPLDGLAPNVLHQATRVALESSLIDDLDWVAPERAAVALYELTSAMAPSKERTAVGRRAFERLYGGNASTFAAVATRMAINSGKPLDTPALSARVHLSYCLPAGTSVNADPLALTLVARPELFARWVSIPAFGALPTRAMAARILERAAREAVRATKQGDPGPLSRLLDPTVQASYQTLLSDREPLVWRHAAVARGLLSAVEPRLREEIDLDLDITLSPTEWRRAAVSLVACLVEDPETAMQQCKSLLRSELFERHPSILSTLLWGLPTVIETAPDLARELLDFVSWLDRTDVAETLADLLDDVQNPSIGRSASQRMRSTLSERLDGMTGEERIVAETLVERLDAERHADVGVGAGVRSALIAYETTGAEAAHDIAIEALNRAYAALRGLENSGAATPCGPTLRLLGEIDAGAIASSRLYDLLLLRRRPGDSSASVVEMDRLYDRLGTWLLERSREEAQPDVSLERKRWLSLLHLIDVETSTRRGSEHVAERVAWRVRESVEALLSRLEGDGSDLHRVFCATLARSFDAAVREGVADVSDLMLLSFEKLQSPDSISAVVDASTSAEIRRALEAFVGFLTRALPSETPYAGLLPLDSLAPRFVKLAAGMPLNGSYRGEALRQTLLRLSHSLEVVETARSLSDLLEGDGNEIDELEQACRDLSQLSRSAHRRVLGHETQAAPPDPTGLAETLQSTVSSGQAPEREVLRFAIDELCSGVPAALSQPLGQTLERLHELSVQAPSEVGSRRPPQRNPLPDWLLPRRTIGSFYVVRSLGQGGAASVFEARRIEARRNDRAERYALKVPKYDATVARSLSEREFLDLFRLEAGTLLSLPKHPNLARFVNFDVEARPKPMLVMELIDGNSLERVIRRGLLTTPAAFQYLDGILSGLEAMHAAGLGHLDLKPANVILRDERTAVLVDFGLSGRNLRPGCGTLEYCAPEVLGVVPEADASEPARTDLYAFACLAFETLTGKFLFDGRDETAVIAKHIDHDGWPRQLSDFARLDGMRDLSMLLARCLRKSPKMRPTAREVRRALALPAHDLEARAWPFPASRESSESPSEPRAAEG